MPAVPDVTGQALTYSDARYTTFAAPPPSTDLTLIGQAWAPDQLPDQLITVGTSAVGYQDLWSSLDPATGQPARVRYGGTYPVTTGAMRRA